MLLSQAAVFKASTEAPSIGIADYPFQLRPGTAVGLAPRPRCSFRLIGGVFPPEAFAAEMDEREAYAGARSALAALPDPSRSSTPSQLLFVVPSGRLALDLRDARIPRESGSTS